VGSNSEIQGYNLYSMLYFHRRFTGGITTYLMHVIWPSSPALHPMPIVPTTQPYPWNLNPQLSYTRQTDLWALNSGIEISVQFLYLAQASS